MSSNNDDISGKHTQKSMLREAVLCCQKTVQRFQTYKYWEETVAIEVAADVLSFI